MTVISLSPTNALPSRRRMARLAVSLLVAMLLLEGCRVGPKYVAPSMPPPPAYKESAASAYRGTPDNTWKPAQPQDAMLKGKWWEVFHEPELNELEEQLDINNQNIAQYFQNFMAARAEVGQARASLFPTVTVAPSYSRARSAGALGSSGVASTGSTSSAGGGTFTELALPLDVSWEPDLWGRVRNQIREYRYAAQVSAADLENERLTEQAALAEYYFELRGQDSLQVLYNNMVEVDQKTLDLTRALERTGIDSAVSTAEAESSLHSAEEAAAGIATNRALYEHAIAMLIGKPASSFSMPVKGLTTSVPPIPIGVPSQLLERRPDIAGAERNMAEANALIGYEEAAYYPTLPLTGTGGLEASTISKLFSVPALFWSVGASAQETIFDAGLRKATVAQYTAQFNADLALYKQTMLTAFQQVEDSLASVRIGSEQVVREQQAIDSAQQYVKLETVRYQTGIDPYLDVLAAQNTLLSSQQIQMILRVSELTAAVQLVQALGGGWDATQLPSANAVTTNAGSQQLEHTP